MQVKVLVKEGHVSLGPSKGRTALVPAVSHADATADQLSRGRK